MTTRHLVVAIAVAIGISACTKAAGGYDPGTMTEPPPLSEVVGTDAVSRAKAEEVYFRCTKVARPERRANLWCQLRDRISECKSGNCPQ